MRRFTLVRVKFLSRVFTALNLAPSIATLAIGEQIKPAAESDKLNTDFTDRPSIVFAELGDRLVIRRQAAGQPHYFHIALRLRAQAGGSTEDRLR